jgi:hypothetical protein
MATVTNGWIDVNMENILPRKLPPQLQEKPQFERFIEAAKRVEANSTDESLATTVRKIAPTKKMSQLTPSNEKPKSGKS